jgi:ATP-dependent helicase HrpA
VERQVSGHTVHGYPALVDEGATVGVRVLLSRDEQRRAMWFGTRRLLLLGVRAPVKAVHARLSNPTRLVLTRSPHGSVNALLEDCTAAAVESLMIAHGWAVWDAAAFERLRTAVVADLEDVLTAVVTDVAQVLGAADAAQAQLEQVTGAGQDASVADIRAQLARLLFPGFVTATGRDRLPDLVRYLEAARRRAEKLRQDPARDRALLAKVAVAEEEYAALLRRNPAAVNDEPVRRIRWMIEELRVSLFAQHLGTAFPISDQRIFKAIAELAP